MSAKEKIDFSDMSERDFIAMLMNTAIVGRESGHQVIIRNGRLNQQQSILIALTGYQYKNGRVVETKEENANEPT